MNVEYSLTKALFVDWVRLKLLHIFIADSLRFTLVGVALEGSDILAKAVPPAVSGRTLSAGAYSAPRVYEEHGGRRGVRAMVKGGDVVVSASQNSEKSRYFRHFRTI